MQAAFSRPLKSGGAQCGLCRHFCRLAPGQRGRCGVRVCAEGEGGARLLTLVGGGVAACHADPVEKKPLYHYLSGSMTFSFGTAGCNFDCAWCQNAGISRGPAETGRIPATPADPEGLVRAALAAKCASVAFTYTEPTVFYELLAATADAAKQKGLGAVLVSNGYQSPACLDSLGPRIDAANIDLKAFRDATYRKFCGAGLRPVLDNLKRIKALGWWLEVTTLIVPGVNDDPAELRDAALFIRQELGEEVPWHVSAFHPCRHMPDTPPTSPGALSKAADIGRDAGLLFVYTGNVPGLDLPTLCPRCGSTLVGRRAFHARPVPGFRGACPHCGRKIAGIWSPP
jgi:pyruvate formate lyase activating enzyme